MRGWNGNTRLEWDSIAHSFQMLMTGHYERTAAELGKWPESRQALEWDRGNGS